MFGLSRNMLLSNFNLVWKVCLSQLDVNKNGIIGWFALKQKIRYLIFCYFPATLMVGLLCCQVLLVFCLVAGFVDIYIFFNFLSRKVAESESTLVSFWTFVGKNIQPDYFRGYIFLIDYSCRCSHKDFWARWVRDQVKIQKIVDLLEKQRSCWPWCWLFQKSILMVKIWLVS